jgi:hypothetical protein
MCRAAAAVAAATKPAIFPLLVFVPECSISDKEMHYKKRIEAQEGANTSS